MKNQTVDEFLDEQGCTNQVARTMVHLELHKRHKPYSEAEKELAKHMFFHSASGYNQLRKAGCNLPHGNHVRRLLNAYDIQPGLNDNIFNKVEECLSKLPEDQRICALKMDELARKCLEEYSKGLDCIEGLVDFGPLGRFNERAFVMCLDSLNPESKWRQVLSYLLPGKSGMSGEHIKLMVEMILKKLKKIGANVKILTCDQGLNSQNAFKLLKISATNPWFEVDGELYCGLPDFPHLIKRLFAMLRFHGFISIGTEVIVSFKDFVDVLKFDRTMSSSRLLSHITDAHLNPNAFEGMNVLRPMQVFSRKFASAIRTAGKDPHGLKSDTWENSANFAEKLDTVIDYCNAYHLRYGESRKRPLSHTMFSRPANDSKRIH